MLNIKDINRYFLRVSNLVENPDLVGRVIYLRHVAANGIVVSMTNDCRPEAVPIPLSATANDNGWYDVTELVLDANCAIAPRYDMCTFVNELASQYRNHIDDQSVLHVCQGLQAVGRLCFIGRKHKNYFEFSRTAYFVVSQDKSGFYIVYSGFCEPKKKQLLPNVVQRVLRLEGTGQMFFEAEPIVTYCNTAYNTDVALRNKYVNDLQDRVAASSTATTHAADPKKDPESLAGMHLD